MAARRNESAALAADAVAKASDAPYSNIIASRMSSARALTAACSRPSSAMRSLLLVRDIAVNARFAAAIARNASARSPRRTWPMRSSVDGLNRSNNSVPCGSTNAPSM